MTTTVYMVTASTNIVKHLLVYDALCSHFHSSPMKYFYGRLQMMLKVIFVHRLLQAANQKPWTWCRHLADLAVTLSLRESSFCWICDDGGRAVNESGQDSGRDSNESTVLCAWVSACECICVCVGLMTARRLQRLLDWTSWLQIARTASDCSSWIPTPLWTMRWQNERIISQSQHPTQRHWMPVVSLRRKRISRMNTEAIDKYS
jgi:hypothetical protein